MINDTNQTQTAGDNTQQIQGQNVTIINQHGITEQRAREICSEMFAVAKRDLTIEAEKTALERVGKLEDRLMPRMHRIEGALQNFAEPSFQVFLTKANKAAACTDRESDYDLLSELLIHRIEKKNSRKDQVGLNRAVEIVDQITDEALNGLTVLFTVGKIDPVADTLEVCLWALNILYKKLPLSSLPTGKEWIEELDILDAIRGSSLGVTKKIEDFWAEKYTGFITTGIKIDGENWPIVTKMLIESGLSIKSLIPNALLDNYVLIPVMDEERIDALKQSVMSNGNVVQVPISEEQKQVLHKIFLMYDKSPEMMTKVKKTFMEKIDSYDAVKTVREWWNSIPHAVTVTAVGRILAHANAKRCDPSLPDLN